MQNINYIILDMCMFMPRYIIPKIYIIIEKLPLIPLGAKDRLSVNIDKVTGALNCNSLTTPSPPQYSPLPPEFLRKVNVVKNTG